MTDWKNGIASIEIPTPFAVGNVNVQIVKGDALTLIDTGIKTKEGKEAIQAGLSRLGIGMEDIEQIIITHHHPDHIGGIDFFSPGTALLGHKKNSRWLSPTESFMGENERFFISLASEMGVPDEFRSSIGNIRGEKKYGTKRKLTAYLEEGEEIPGLKGWTSLHTPGHAGGHIVLYRELDGTVIGGDLLLEKISPNPIIEPPEQEGDVRQKSQLLLNSSLRKILDLPVHTVYSGHGSKIQSPHELIQKRLEAQHKRAMKVKEMLKERPLTAFQAGMSLFPKAIHRETGLALSETQGQLDYLLDLGEIREEKNGRITVYSVR